MKVVVCLVTVLCVATVPSHAQEIEADLSGSTASQGFSVINSNSINLFSVRGNQRVGILTSSPSATLHVKGEDGLLATGTFNSGSIPATGSGTRFMWYPKKAALRVGRVDATEWDDANIGSYSTAFGRNTTASGDVSIAFGIRTEASGGGSTAMGVGTVASGPNATATGTSTTSTQHSSTATGFNTTASNHSAFASGNSTTASGHSSTAMGSNATASASHSFAIGRYTTASGLAAVAIGYYTTASGEQSTSLGSYVSSNDKDGCLMIGDASTTTTMNATKSNRYYARFDHGYVLYTKSDRTTGMFAFNGDNSWTSFSDSTRKERFHQADADQLLSQFRTLRLGSWSYKGDDRRHYGPMAQEWFAAFGHDGIGTIGNDTTLATADVDGILCIAVKGLEARSSSNREETAKLLLLLDEKDAEINRLKQQFTNLEEKCLERIDRLEQLVSTLLNEEEPEPTHARFINSLNE